MSATMNSVCFMEEDDKGERLREDDETGGATLSRQCWIPKQ